MREFAEQIPVVSIWFMERGTGIIKNKIERSTAGVLQKSRFVNTAVGFLRVSCCYETNGKKTVQK